MQVSSNPDLKMPQCILLYENEHVLFLTHMNSHTVMVLKDLDQLMVLQAMHLRFIIIYTSHVRGK